MARTERPTAGDVTRRRMIAGLGVGAVAAAAPSVADAATSRGTDGDDDRGPDRRFDRMFPELAPFAEATDEVRAALAEIGAPGGPMDGGAEAIEDVPENPDNVAMPSGYTFMGQFLDHDLTRDAASTLGRPTGLDRSTNLRTARFDLDSVLGGGPGTTPDLYEPDDRFRLRVESGGRFEDVPRDGTGTAVIGDDRNDENLLVAQLHAAYLLFHGAVLDGVRADGRGGRDAFDEAVHLVRWHHQWAILHDVLPAFVGQAMVDDVLSRGLQVFEGDRIPVEFATAAYRFGHSLVRPGYRVNGDGDDGDPFAAPVFDPSLDPDDPDPDDLSGGHRAPRRFVDWAGFFDFGDGAAPTHTKRIDTRLSAPLLDLPVRVVDAGRGADPGPTSLATRNLWRHLTWGIPSGQDVAGAMGAEPLGTADLDDLRGAGIGLEASTPLWLYVLREADVVADGVHLGPVGGRIVAEVFVGLLRADRGSFLARQPSWTPTLAGRHPAGFGVADLLAAAGVGPTDRAAGVDPSRRATVADPDPAEGEAARSSTAAEGRRSGAAPRRPGRSGTRRRARG